MSTIVIISLTSTFSFAGEDTIHHHNKTKRPDFSTIDSNNDNHIDFEEFFTHRSSREHAQKIFKKVDQDNDGTISKEELMAQKYRHKVKSKIH